MRTIFDPDSVQVIARDLMDVQESRREKVMDLVRKNRQGCEVLREKACCRTLRWGTTYLWQESDSPASRRTYEYVGTTVEGGITNRRTRVRRGRHRHGAFA